MKSVLTVLLMMLALALAACHPGRHRQMQQQLADLQACNQADSLLTDLPLAQSLAEWFDDHGTANEQLLAHYLLGRTHTDRGEAPAVLIAGLSPCLQQESGGLQAYVRAGKGFGLNLV